MVSAIIVVLIALVPVILGGIVLAQHPEILAPIFDPPPPPPQCPTGYTYQNGQCISTNPTQPPTCPTGYSFQNGQCKPNADTTSPTVTITSPANGVTLPAGTTSVPVSGTSSDNIAVIRVEVSVNNGVYVTTSGTTSWSSTLGGLQNGATYTIKARGQDAVGNVSPIKTVTITVANPTTQPPTGTLPTASSVHSTESLALPPSVGTFVYYMANEFHEGEGTWKMISDKNAFFIPKHLKIHSGTQLSFHMADARWGTPNEYQIKIINKATQAVVHTSPNIQYPDEGNANSPPITLAPGNYRLDFNTIKGPAESRGPHLNGQTYDIEVLSTPKTAGATQIVGAFYTTTFRAMNMYNGDSTNAQNPAHLRNGWLGYYQTEFPARGLTIDSQHSFTFYPPGGGSTPCKFDQMADPQRCVFPDEGGAAWHDNKSGRHTLLIWKSTKTLAEVQAALSALTIQNVYI